MNINDLFTDQGLRAFTEERRDLHLKDAREYGQLADVIRRRLAQTPIEGDGMWAARVRARRVYRHLRAMERASARAAARAEALYTTYVHHVLDVPRRREVEQARREQRRAVRHDRRTERRAVAGSAVAGSFGQSVRALHAEARQQRHLDAEPHLFVVDDGIDGGSAPAPTVADYFPKRRQQ